MTTPEPLAPTALRRRCDPQQFAFTTTAELEPLEHAIGQDRAFAALRFGAGIRREGFDLFVLGPTGTGRHGTVRQYLERLAAQQPVPSDWCYVNNFADPQQPRALRLPAGLGVQLRDDMIRLVDELGAAIPAAFKSDDYRARKEAVLTEFKEQQEAAFEALKKRATEQDVMVVRTPDGLALAPMRGGEVISSKEFDELPEAERSAIEKKLEVLQKELERLVRQAPKWAHEQRERLRALDREITSFAVNHLLDALQQKYAELREVGEYLQAVREDVLEHQAQFMGGEPNPLQAMLGMAGAAQRNGGDFRRYRVNVIVDHSQAAGAPVVHEDQPGHHRLIGRIEHLSQLGALVTDFTLIKPGALHAANGGYLMLDAHKLLVEPFAYDALKRVLRAREIAIESLAERLSLVSTVSLEPEPIPLDVKVVLVGERMLYYLLSALDPEFGELFKVPVDFDDALPWGDDTALAFARLIGTFARQKQLRGLDPGAVARLVEHAARAASDQQKLTARIGPLFDIVREADFCAGEGGRAVVTAADVQRAIDAREHRADRLRERVQEQIRRGIQRIETKGEVVGQVNGLSVVELGGFAFGVPSRITARVRLGKGDVVDIEREVDLGGPIHSKGVLILHGFLGGRFAADQPLSLSASLVFEQSYGGVEGDSASAAETFALLSALADAPVAQRFAVTGSIDQHGRIQAIGGVNEKIEGFFDVCRAAGPTGDQGVLIPTANVAHLMLRQDVVDAVAAGTFQVCAVATVDEGIALLTGVPAGQPDAAGVYPEGTINRRVRDRLAAMAAKVRAFAAAGRIGPDGAGGTEALP